jgi:hypothetical protein
MLKLMIVIALGAGTTVLAAPKAQAASAGYCAHYADLAAWEFRRGRACLGVVNGMWHGNHRVHYGWCRTASEGAARRKDAIRGARLHACGY